MYNPPDPAVTPFRADEAAGGRLDSNLLKTKSIEQLVDDVEKGKHLKRTLTAFDLTLLGIGAIIGTGIFVLTGTAAANQAGPAITISYMAAGLACAFAALCYAEFAAMIPISGSAYAYAYATLGEIIAWTIGWDLILEYAVGSMTVAIGWSGYFQRILAGFGWQLPAWMCAAPGTMPGAVINLPAVLIVLAITALLVIGIRESARFNATMVAIKLAAVLFFLRRRLQVREARELVAVRALRLVRDHGRGGGRLLRLHRLRRRLHHGGGGQEPQPRPADRHHLLARHLHGPVHRGGRRPHRDRAGHLLPQRRGGAARDRHRAARREHRVPERAGGLRAARDQPGLGRGADLGRRGGRHHQRAARDADGPAAHLLLDEPRPAAAGGREQGAPALRHPLHHDDHHGRRRRLLCRHSPDRRRRGDDVDRHAVRLRGRVLRRHHAAHQAPRGPPALQGALRLPLPRARRRLVPLPDAEPQRGHLGALPRLARPRDDDLLVLRADPQPAGRPAGAGRPGRSRAGRERRDHARRAGPLQRLLHDGARLHDRARDHHRGHHEVARDPRDAPPGRQRGARSPRGRSRRCSSRGGSSRSRAGSRPPPSFRSFPSCGLPRARRRPRPSPGC